MLALRQSEWWRTNARNGSFIISSGWKLMMFWCFTISIAQISVWIWSNALYNSRGNQINIVQITILQLIFTNQMFVFDERGVPGEKNSHGRVENQQTQSTWHRLRKSNPGHIGALTTRLTVPPSRARFRGQFESQFQNKPFLTILPFKMCFSTL